MCRFLAWTGTAPRSAADALDPDHSKPSALDAFVALGSAHPDGWGMAWWPPDGAGRDPSVVHSTAPAHRDPSLRSALHDTASEAGLIHLRWATPGLAVTPANCHPFVREGMAMAHNGAIYPRCRLEEMLTPEWSDRLAGTTDSERYFLSVLAEVQQGRGNADGLTNQVRRLFLDWTPSSLNAVLLTSEELFVVCAYNPDMQPPVPEPPDRYYRLSWRADGNGVVVASSGFPQPTEDGWTPLDNMSMLVVPRAGGAPSTRPLGIPVPEGVQPPVADAADIR